MICKGIRTPVILMPHTYVLYYINYYYTHTLFIMLWRMAKDIQHALVVYATT